MTDTLCAPRVREFRSGFVSFVGRPNTGKSTLMSALVGTKVAITSNRPQTTRHTIRGIVHREDFQIVLVDTPGLHRPRTPLGQRLNDLVRDTIRRSTSSGRIPADEPIGPGDRWIHEQIRTVAPNTTLMAIVTKIDRCPRSGGRSAGGGQRTGRTGDRDRAGVGDDGGAGRRS
jgi:GTP-binding protein Era